MSAEQPALRVALVGIVVVSLFSALFARLYYLQVMRETTVEEVFGSVRLREVHYEGPRGRILDRDGRVVVDNRESVVITVDRRRFDALADPADLTLRLARALNAGGFPTKVTDIDARIADPRYDPLKPVPIAEDVSGELEAYLLERLADYPSVDVVRRQVRTYPHGTLAAHILGYTGPISGEELDTRAEDPKRYQPGDEIGKSGVERIFEKELRAVPGIRTIEVDPTEREIATRADVAPVPGRDLQLTVDLELQLATETLLAEALMRTRQLEKRRPTDPERRAPAGAAVVLDAKTSEVLALASHPTFSPAEFSSGISEFRFRELNDPAAFFPFTNRAIQSLYSPGSTFKPFTAVAALERGLVSAEETIVDRGVWELKNCTDTCVFANANSTPYGRIDLRDALTVSSDVYFYRLGEAFWNQQDRFGIDAVQATARRFGLGKATGVQLPEEAAGLISDPAFKKARHEENPDAFPYGEWFTGDNVNLAIGQGDVGVTPLQLANAYAALANGGQLRSTSVAKALLDQSNGSPVRTFAPRDLGAVALPPDVRQPVVDGLAGVVGSDSGTAAGAFSGFPEEFTVAGKTGTAEVPPKADTALFAGFGPLADPRYVVVAVIEEAGFASETAAPLVRRIFEQLDEVRPLVPVAPPPVAPPANGELGANPPAAFPAANVDPSEEDEVAPAGGLSGAETPPTVPAPSPATGSPAAPAVASPAPAPPAVPAGGAPPARVANRVRPARFRSAGSRPTRPRPIRRRWPCRC